MTIAPNFRLRTNPAGAQPRRKALVSIQALRGFAAVTVVFFHVTQIFSAPKYFGVPPFAGFWAWGMHGVDLFFVISGFIMGHIHYKDFVACRGARRFFASRVARIYLPYWPLLLVLIALYFMLPTLGTEASRDPRDPATILRSVLLLPGTNGVLAVAWTLEHEMTFYAVIFLALLNRWAGVVAFALWQVASFWAAFGGGEVTKFSTVGPLEIEFACGLACALLFRFRSQIPFPRTICVLGVAVFLGLGLWETYVRPFGEISLMRAFSYGLASSLVVAGAAFGERAGLIRIAPWLLLGDASYSIYLVHYDLLVAAGKLLHAARLDRPGAVTFVASAAVIIVVGVGCLYHLAVEKPLTSYGRRLLDSRLGVARDVAVSRTP